MQLEKPKLFPDKKSFIWAMGIIFFLLLLRLGVTYHAYLEFVSKPFYYTYANVLTAYEKTKHERTYTVLKLKSEKGFTFYTTTHLKKVFKHKRLRLQIFPNESIRFQDYLGIFYVKSKLKEEKEQELSYKDGLLKTIAIQHQNNDLKQFYQAIFFATPLSKQVREKITLLGVSHLVALSGFHLGILWAVLYGILLALYRPIQQKFFPYRYALLDVGFVVMLLLGLYVWFVDFPPSLVRSYAMVLVAWIVILLGLELLSFGFLTMVGLMLVTLFNSLLVSLSFWFSMIGVFYIFLLLTYSKAMSQKSISFFVIPFGIFILMLPVVHTIFGTTSSYQLLSPLLSVVFIVFYPLMIGLHLVGMGEMFDENVLWLFSLPSTQKEAFLPLWSMLVYGGLSIGAIWYKTIFYILLGVALLYAIYLFVFV